MEMKLKDDMLRRDITRIAMSFSGNRLEDPACMAIIAVAVRQTHARRA
jgi:hypothetical protein